MRLEFVAHPKRALSDQLVEQLTRAGRNATLVEVSGLLAQGSVFRDKKRWRDPGCPGDGAPFEVFWPDLPIMEFTLDVNRIVWQDEHLLVVDKPPRVNTAPSPFSDIDCLTWGVQKYLGPTFAIHAVHRLDRDTRGLVLFAKNKNAELGLHELFRDRRVRKVYRAVTPAFAAAPAVGSSALRWRDTLDYRGKVQRAATTAVRQGTDENGRLVWLAFPHTGRPHQIRRHFARYLVALWGDQAYAPGVYPREDDLGLACVAYRFRHPITGERLRVTLEL